MNLKPKQKNNKANSKNGVRGPSKHEILVEAYHHYLPRGSLKPLTEHDLHGVVNRIKEVHNLTHSTNIRESMTMIDRSIIPRVREAIWGETQIPVLTFPGTVGSITTDAGGEIKAASEIAGQYMPNNSDWAVFFDEYRILKAEFEYVPVYSGSALSTIYPVILGQYIDYDDAVVPSSYQQCANHVDNMKFHSTSDYCHMVAHPSYQPDMAWLSTTALTTTFFTWKAYGNNGPASTNLGFLIIKVKIQFRGVQG